MILIELNRLENKQTNASITSTSMVVGMSGAVVTSGSSNNFQRFNQVNKIQVTYQSQATTAATPKKPMMTTAAPNANVNHYQPNHTPTPTNQQQQQQNNKISPTSVYHLVNNNNNKNDNTLKKRNALVAFEFKTLLDKVKKEIYYINI